MSTGRGFRALILGPPGGGKGFISQMIVKKYNAVHISTGDKLRDHILHRTAIGKIAERYINQGELVPDELLRSIVNSAVSKAVAKRQAFILDGYPRNREQAVQLERVVVLDFVLYLKMSARTIMERVRNRMVHLPSGRVYNKGAMAPKVPGRDDITGERLVRRPDDDPKVVLARLELYDEKIGPVVRHYEKKNILYTIHVRQHESLWPYIERYLNKRWKNR